MNEGMLQFRLSYEISPIILTNGIAADVPGGLLPIISITQPQDFNDGILSGGDPEASLDDFFAHFVPMAGSTAIDNEIGNYPFANQAVAANAIIANPLKISLLMICPARTDGGYAAKTATFANLQTQLAKHCNSGGTFTVATPALLYPDMILTGLRDITSGDSHQAQSMWQWDFVKPLLTLEAAQAAQNSLMTKNSQGVKVDGDPPAWSGQQPAIGNPSSGQGPSTVPASTSLVGASAGGSSGGTSSLGRSISI